MELIAQGPEPEQYWRRQIPDGQVIRLGRAPRNGWAVPWDRHTSREHAEIALVGNQLKVRRLEVARNYISYLGESSNEFTMSTGEEFRIGVTKFCLAETDSIQGQASPDSTTYCVSPGPVVTPPAADTPRIELDASSEMSSDRLGSVLTICSRPNLTKSASPDAVRVAPNGQQVAVQCGSSIEIFDIRTGDVIRVIKTQECLHPDLLTQICWSSDGQRLFVTHESELSCWILETGEQAWCKGLGADSAPDAFGDIITGIVTSPLEEALVVADFKQRLHFFDDEGSQLIKSIATEDEDADNYSTSRMDYICNLATSPDGYTLVIVTNHRVSLYRLMDDTLSSLPVTGFATTASWLPNTSQVAVGTEDGYVRICNVESGRTVRVLEGHTGRVSSIAFWDEGRYLASTSDDGTLRLWDCETWENLAVFSAPGSDDKSLAKIWAHPCQPVLMTIDESDSELIIWDFDLNEFLDVDAESATSHYTNAKVVFVGDSSVGKSALCHRLANQEWQPTEGSTHGMNVVQFESNDEKEIMLWDFAGQPEYRLIHQLFLNQTVVALLLYDPTKSDDSFFGIEYWERALDSCVGTSHQKLLVAARTDVGSVRIANEDIESYCFNHQYLGHYPTSARTGDGCRELGEAIQNAIPWEQLPKTSSPRVFKQIKQFLVDVRESQRPIVRERELLLEFASHENHESCSAEEFETVVGHIENAGIIKRLSFGGLILLRPELLNGVAADIIDAARNHDSGLGAVSKGDVLNGNIPIRDEYELEQADEIYLLHSTVELFLGLGLALEQDGSLVFPSKFNRRMPELADDPIIHFRFSFSGPIDNIYTTLVVKLYYSGAFTLNQLWKNAAEFHNGMQQICGIQLQGDESGRGILRIFFSKDVPDNDKALFVKFVADHFSDRKVEASRERLYSCPSCGERIQDRKAVQRAIASDITELPCLYCFNQVPLSDSIEVLDTDDDDLRKHVERMEHGAHSRMNRRSGLVAAQAEMTCSSFQSWAGGCRHANMAIVFTDIVDSTRLNREIGDLDWSKIRKRHFVQAEETVNSYDGYLIKNLGDGLLASFHNALDAVRFATTLETEPGHEIVKIRVGVNVGPVEVDDNDVYGQHVNLTARIAAKAATGGVLVSHRTKEELDTFGLKHKWNWEAIPDVSLKGFEQPHTLWSLSPQSN